MSKIIWTKEEIDFLKTAYKEGWRLKEIAYLLKRSVTAVNKAMHRFSVRTNEPRIKRKSEDHLYAKEILIKNFSPRTKTFQKCTHSKNNIFSTLSDKGFQKSQNFQNLREVLMNSSSYEQYEKSHSWDGVKKHRVEYDSDKFIKRENNIFLSPYVYPHVQQIVKKNFKNPESFVSFLDVINWLQKKGFVLEKAQECSIGLNQYGTREVFYKIKLPCIFQSSPLALKTQVQIVILANKLRLKESLPLFHVTEVTQE